MIRKVVLFGSESTGKTTLAQQLADHYHTVWVPEYSRIYQEEKKRDLTLEDVIPIALGQLKLEQKTLEKANRLLICDTDLLETKVYSQAYNGTCPPWLLEQIPHHLADLYLLTDIDLPWEPDGIRDRPDNRAEMHTFFHNELVNWNVPFEIISGNYKERLAKAIKTIDTFLFAQVF
ncbi:ATP-binding protein [Rhodocytophaga aerolata]|uniref:ATP-binding protein n=1 Tax=Rhodocytophaga aerolata TaxID=455078 RepID=A0ABT8R1R5_9BACT|nr:ATP-binding protein [Rhodocytophaga aerolata]MDO1444732.1 ATP-binding protein [Rhodocytophaga aerolata]